MKNILFLFVSFISIACSQRTSENTINVSVKEAKELMISTPILQIVDVRTPEEWSQGVIDSTLKVNIRDADFADKVKLLDKNAPTLVYCKSGGRSVKATLAMEKFGFTNLYNLLGGYDEYSTTK